MDRSSQNTGLTLHIDILGREKKITNKWPSRFKALSQCTDKGLSSMLSFSFTSHNLQWMYYVIHSFYIHPACNTHCPGSWRLALGRQKRAYEMQPMISSIQAFFYTKDALIISCQVLRRKLVLWPFVTLISSSEGFLHKFYETYLNCSSSSGFKLWPPWEVLCNTFTQHSLYTQWAVSRVVGVSLIYNNFATLWCVKT